MILGYFELKSDAVRQRACSRILELPDGSVLVAREPLKSRDQECHYHALIGDIAKDPPNDALAMLSGKQLDETSWKRLLIDAFKFDTKDDPELKPHWEKFGELQLLPALNHPGFVAVGDQSRRFSVKLASAFIDWLQAFQAGAR